MKHSFTLKFYQPSLMKVLVTAGLTSALFVAPPAEAESLRCNGKVLTAGDTTYEVTKACGQPQDKQSRTEYRSEKQRDGAKCPEGAGENCSVSRSKVVEVLIEEWTYDRGRMHLLQHLKFENGKLVAVRSGNRGGR